MRPRVANISAVVRPAPAVRSALAIMHPGLAGIVPIKQVLESETAVDSLAKLLTEAIETQQTTDGRIDMRDVAAHVLREMGKNQK